MSNLKVEEIMTTDPLTIRPDDTVYKALFLMRDNKIRQLPVCQNGKIVGIITDRDIREVIGKYLDADKQPTPDNLSMIVADHMTIDPVTIDPDTPLEEAIQIINTKKFGGLPVCRQDKILVGIITVTDISGLLLELLKRQG